MRGFFRICTLVGVVLASQQAMGQVRCTMPNGLVIEQQLSMACPAGARSAQRLDGSPAAVRGAVAPSSIVTDKRLVSSQVVSRSELGADWPLTVESATVRCMYPDSQRPQLRAYLVVVDGVFYAINGIARTHANAMGWRPINAIWRDNPAIPGTKVPITPLLERAQRVC